MPSKTRKNTDKTAVTEPTVAMEGAAPRRRANKKPGSTDAAAPTAAPAPVAAEVPSQPSRRRKSPVVKILATEPAEPPVPPTGERDAVAEPMATGPAAEATAVDPATDTSSTSSAPGDASSESSAPAVPGRASSASALKPLAALGVDEGVFVLVAVPSALDPVEAIARYAEEPLPHLVSPPQGAWLKGQGVGSTTVYAAFVPWPQPPAGMVKLGCITAGGRKPVFDVECLRWGHSEAASLARMFKRYGPLLVPAFDAVLPGSHPLRKSRVPAAAASVVAAAPAQAQAAARVVKGHFDGVMDDLAHGWAFCPAQPSRRLTVEVMCGDEVVARGLADRFRDDLQTSGIGDGHHHFRLVLSSELFDAQPRELSVRVVEAGGTPLPERVSVTLPHRQSVYPVAMPRAEMLAEARRLSERAQLRPADAAQSLLQAFRMAALQQETGQFAPARAGYEQLMGTVGPNALCHCRIAETWLLENALQEAQAGFEVALQLDAGFAWAHQGLGNVSRLQGQSLAAEAAYQKAQQCAPRTSALRCKSAAARCSELMARAVALEMVGHKGQAIGLMRTAVLEQPDNEAACTLLDAWLRGTEDDLPLALPDSVQSVAKAIRLLGAVLDEAEQRLDAAVRARRRSPAP